MKDQPTHAIKGFGVLHTWGTEEAILDEFTDPRARNGHPYSNDYEVVEVTQADIDAEVATREQDQRDQRACSWAM